LAKGREGNGDKESSEKRDLRQEMEKLTILTAAQKIEGYSLVLLQVNCSSIYNNIRFLEFC
jgi:hypothetical protein